MNTVQRINHRLCSCPHFAKVSHSSVLGIERRFPIKGSFLGPGGRCRPRRWPFIQCMTKTVRAPRIKASRANAICGKASNYWEKRCGKTKGPCVQVRSQYRPLQKGWRDVWILRPVESNPPQNKIAGRPRNDDWALLISRMSWAQSNESAI